MKHLSSISTSVDHAAALARVRALMAAGGSDAAVAAEARRIEAYERINFPIPAPSRADALRFRREQERNPLRHCDG